LANALSRNKKVGRKIESLLRRGTEKEEKKSKRASPKKFPERACSEKEATYQLLSPGTKKKVPKKERSGGGETRTNGWRGRDDRRREHCESIIFLKRP